MDSQESNHAESVAAVGPVRRGGVIELFFGLLCLGLIVILWPIIWRLGAAVLALMFIVAVAVLAA